MPTNNQDILDNIRSFLYGCMLKESIVNTIIERFSKALTLASNRAVEKRDKEIFEDLMKLDIMPYQDHEFIDTCKIHKLFQKYRKPLTNK